MIHEIGHMFGLKHCIYFSCIMNGSNHLDENKGKPMELCPVCVRKLHENMQFNMLERYMALSQVCKSTNSEVFKSDGDWYENVVNLIKESYAKFYSKKEEPSKK